MDVMDIYQKDYEEYCDIGVEWSPSKYEWLSAEVFNLVTYDCDLDDSFGKSIFEVCKSILERRTYSYIKESDEHYKTYILVCQLLGHRDWINWGTSIRGAWFEKSIHGGEKILSMRYDVEFTEDNMRKLIEFVGS